MSRNDSNELQAFITAARRPGTNNYLAYRDKQLRFFTDALENVASNRDKHENVAIYIESILRLFIRQKRFADIASVYFFLKNGENASAAYGFFYPAAKNFLRLHVNELFTDSTWCESREIGELLSDILDGDTAKQMELISHIFNQFGLLKLRLSTNIYLQFVKIAEGNIEDFIDHTDLACLAFYLNSLPNLPVISQEHIKKLTLLILFPPPNKNHSKKILQAMAKFAPSPDILFIYMLSQNRTEMCEAVELMKKSISEKKISDKEFASKKSQYFISKALASEFYDFHTLEKRYKITYAFFLARMPVKFATGQIFSLLSEDNPGNNPKIIETKCIFIKVLNFFLKRKKSLTLASTIETFYEKNKEKLEEKVLKDIEQTLVKPAADNGQA